MSKSGDLLLWCIMGLRAWRAFCLFGVYSRNVAACRGCVGERNNITSFRSRCIGKAFEFVHTMRR